MFPASLSELYSPKIVSTHLVKRVGPFMEDQGGTSGDFHILQFVRKESFNSGMSIFRVFAHL